MQQMLQLRMSFFLPTSLSVHQVEREGFLQKKETDVLWNRQFQIPRAPFFLSLHSLPCSASPPPAPSLQEPLSHDGELTPSGGVRRELDWQPSQAGSHGLHLKVRWNISRRWDSVTFGSTDWLSAGSHGTKRERAVTAGTSDVLVESGSELLSCFQWNISGPMLSVT